MREQDARAIAKIIERAAREIQELLGRGAPPPGPATAVPAWRPPAKAAVYPVGTRHRRSDRPPDCSECGAEMRASKFKNPFYCVECYRARKDSGEAR